MSIFNDEIKEMFGKKWHKVIITVCVLIAILIISGLVFRIWPFSLIYKVANTNTMIQNYEWFYDQYNVIQAQQANISITSKDAPEYQGMVMVLNNAIGEYNSRSRQITRNLWKADDLPYKISLIGE